MTELEICNSAGDVQLNLGCVIESKQLENGDLPEMPFVPFQKGTHLLEGIRQTMWCSLEM